MTRTPRSHLMIGWLGALSAACATNNFASAAEPVPTNEQIPCTCRYKGADIPVGRSVCIVISDEARLMVCDRVLNNTAWKLVSEGCPQASLSLTTRMQ